MKAMGVQKITLGMSNSQWHWMVKEQTAVTWHYVQTAATVALLMLLSETSSA